MLVSVRVKEILQIIINLVTKNRKRIQIRPDMFGIVVQVAR